MQQATVAKSPSSVVGRSGALPAGAPQRAFVINLCSSTTPVALSPPDHAGLKRFTFFVSRRREEGRERFRLHMGYFESQEEAEKLLDIVREIYPGAWAGSAPGRQQRAASAAVAAATVGGAATAVDAVPAPPVPQAAAAQAAAAPSPPAASPDEPRPASEDASLELLPDAGPSRPAAGAAESDQAAATRSLNNVRAAIASLDDKEQRAPVLRPIPQLKPAAEEVRAPLVHAAPAPALPAASRGARVTRSGTDVEISNAQALPGL